MYTLVLWAAGLFVVSVLADVNWLVIRAAFEAHPLAGIVVGVASAVAWGALLIRVL